MPNEATPTTNRTMPILFSQFRPSVSSIADADFMRCWAVECTAEDRSGATCGGAATRAEAIGGAAGGGGGTCGTFTYPGSRDGRAGGCAGDGFGGCTAGAGGFAVGGAAAIGASGFCSTGGSGTDGGGATGRSGIGGTGAAEIGGATGVTGFGATAAGGVATGCSTRGTTAETRSGCSG